MDRDKCIYSFKAPGKAIFPNITELGLRYLPSKSIDLKDQHN